MPVALPAGAARCAMLLVSAAGQLWQDRSAAAGRARQRAELAAPTPTLASTTDLAALSMSLACCASVRLSCCDSSSTWS